MLNQETIIWEKITNSIQSLITHKKIILHFFLKMFVFYAFALFFAIIFAYLWEYYKEFLKNPYVLYPLIATCWIFWFIWFYKQLRFNIQRSIIIDLIKDGKELKETDIKLIDKKSKEVIWKYIGFKIVTEGKQAFQFLSAILIWVLWVFLFVFWFAWWLNLEDGVAYYYVGWFILGWIFCFLITFYLLYLNLKYNYKIIFIPFLFLDNHNKSYKELINLSEKMTKIKGFENFIKVNSLDILSQLWVTEIGKQLDHLNNDIWEWTKEYPWIKYLWSFISKLIIKLMDEIQEYIVLAYQKEVYEEICAELNIKTGFNEWFYLWELKKEL